MLGFVFNLGKKIFLFLFWDIIVGLVMVFFVLVIGVFVSEDKIYFVLVVV